MAFEEILHVFLYQRWKVFYRERGHINRNVRRFRFGLEASKTDTHDTRREDALAQFGDAALQRPDGAARRPYQMLSGSNLVPKSLPRKS
jgi:hypothetical protein